MKLNDLTGQRFGRLTVLRRGEDYVCNSLHPFGKAETVKRVCWVCRCDCGNEATVMGCALTGGKTKSCGCLRREYLSERNRKKT